MINHFKITNMRLISSFFGIEVIQLNKDIFLFQELYDILKKFKMELCNLILTSIEERLKLGKDNLDELVDLIRFRRMIRVYDI